MMDTTWILAQAGSDSTGSGITSTSVGSEPAGESGTVQEDPGNSNNPPADKVPQKPGLMQFLPFILLFVVMYFILFRGPKKKQQQHRQMIQALKKGDKIQTIGGIIGNVVDIRDDEITLKIDESNNTKMKILRSAINRNLSEE